MNHHQAGVEMVGGNAQGVCSCGWKGVPTSDHGAALDQSVRHIRAEIKKQAQWEKRRA